MSPRPSWSCGPDRGASHFRIRPEGESHRKTMWSEVACATCFPYPFGPPLMIARIRGGSPLEQDPTDGRQVEVCRTPPSVFPWKTRHPQDNAGCAGLNPVERETPAPLTTHPSEDTLNPGRLPGCTRASRHTFRTRPSRHPGRGHEVTPYPALLSGKTPFSKKIDMWRFPDSKMLMDTDSHTCDYPNGRDPSGRGRSLLLPARNPTTGVSRRDAGLRAVPMHRAGTGA
jgi:hypothetical protein